MPAKPKLRKKTVGKSVYWFTKAGGEKYFGNVKDVPYEEARRLFAAHLNSLAEDGQASKNKALTAGELIDLFLGWIEKHRSQKTYSSRRTYCSRFASFRVGGKGGKRIADLPANRIKSSDMDAWLDHLAG